MTPALTLLKKNNIHYVVHEYQHDPANTSYGLEAAEKLQLNVKQVFKTLVVAIDNKTLAVAVIPVAAKLNMKQFAKILNAKKAEMAEPKAVIKSTGYILGGVSPLGQKKRLPTVIDNSAEDLNTVYVSAGKRGLEIELEPLALQKLLAAQFAAITQG